MSDKNDSNDKNKDAKDWLNRISDPLFASSLFFLMTSEFFDNWLKDMIPSLRTGSELYTTLVKTLIYAGLYLVYTYIMKKAPFEEKDE